MLIFVMQWGHHDLHFNSKNLTIHVYDFGHHDIVKAWVDGGQGVIMEKWRDQKSYYEKSLSTSPPATFWLFSQ